MDPIYLDHAATSPLRAEVREAMAPHLGDVFGNPSSTHRWGRAAAAALDEARWRCADALGARAAEIVFTRGGTESDNLAVLGRVARVRADGVEPTVVVSSVEHKAVLESAEHACARGAGRLVVVGVNEDGELDLDSLGAALDRGHAMVSIMWVNNETGMVLPLAAVADRVRDRGGTLHTDAVQAVGKVPVHVDEPRVDLLTVTGHKIYGPKGAGLLYVRSGTALSPLLHGGGQERGLRPGTEDVAGAVGLSVALELAIREQASEARRLDALRRDLEARVLDGLPGARVNASEAPRAPHIASFAIPDVDGGALLMRLDLEGVAASGGSACNSGAAKGSHVIAALYGDDDPHATVRFSMGRSTRQDDVHRAADILMGAVGKLRGGEP
jgi:cysteine desulfurase